VLDLAGADAKCEGPERSVGGGVRIATYDRHARLSEAELGADDVHDSLLGRVEVEQLDPELPRITHQRIDLPRGQCVGNRQPAVASRDIVVDRTNCQLRSAYPATTQPQTLEGLRRRDLVHQVQIHV
jgi:hypothetical protein